MKDNCKNKYLCSQKITDLWFVFCINIIMKTVLQNKGSKQRVSELQIVVVTASANINILH